jgi:hypothetical protein
MSKFDWRSASGYDRAQGAEITGFAWECLRRNQNYQLDRHGISPTCPPGPPLHVFSAQRRRRLALALRALDARMDGSTYREIAEVLFAGRQIPERAWKTHDLRNRTIRLVQTGFALMRGGYRALLRPPPRKE